MAHDGKSSITTVEVGANLSAAVAASVTDETWLDVGQSNIVRPSIGAQRDVVAAVAIDQDAAQPHLAHLAEGDLHGSAVDMRRCGASSRTRHAAIKGIVSISQIVDS